MEARVLLILGSIIGRGYKSHKDYYTGAWKLIIGIMIFLMTVVTWSHKRVKFPFFDKKFENQKTTYIFRSTLILIYSLILWIIGMKVLNGIGLWRMLNIVSGMNVYWYLFIGVLITTLFALAEYLSYKQFAGFHPQTKLFNKSESFIKGLINHSVFKSEDSASQSNPPSSIAKESEDSHWQNRQASIVSDEVTNVFSFLNNIYSGLNVPITREFVFRVMVYICSILLYYQSLKNRAVYLFWEKHGKYICPCINYKEKCFKKPDDKITLGMLKNIIKFYRKDSSESNIIMRGLNTDDESVLTKGLGISRSVIKMRGDIWKVFMKRTRMKSLWNFTRFIIRIIVVLLLI
jgi:hypothetical protein